VKVLVNAISIKEGGSLVVLTKMLHAMITRRSDIEWHAAVDRGVAGKSLLPPSVTAWTFPWVERSPAHLLYWYEVTLPRLARRLGADVVFSQTNYLPRRSMGCPTLLLEQHAGHFSAEFQRLMEQELASKTMIWSWRRKSAWVRNSVRKATRVTVQTAALARAISEQAMVPGDCIDVVPHGPGLVAPADRPHPWPGTRPWRVGYVSKYGVQKDFATALRAHRELVDRGRAATLVLTLDRTAPGVAAIDRMIDELAIGTRVENHGELNPTAMQRLYDGLDVFVFPSRCESFGFPLVEAMAQGIPVVVARTVSNVEVAGEGALAFAPRDSSGLADAITALMNDRQRYETQAARSLAAGRRFSWERAAAGTLAALERTVRGHRK